MDQKSSLALVQGHWKKKLFQVSGDSYVHKIFIDYVLSLFTQI